MERPTKKHTRYFDIHPMALWWHPTKNGNITPSMVARFSEKKYFFNHDVCGHDYKWALHCIKDNPFCPYCMGSVFCGNKDCLHCFERSFASFNLNNFIWHPTLNLPVEPFMLSKGSDKKYFFYHETCQHSFQKTLKEITQERNPCVCPYCSKTNHRLCEKLECKSCFDRSLASANMEGLIWHPTKNGNILPYMVSRAKSKKYYFKCVKCDHDTFTRVKAAINARGCQYCEYGRHCGDLLCQICKNNSIMSLEMSKYLSPKNDVNVWMLSKGSGVIVLFDCPYCGCEYRSKVGAVSAGHWCLCRKNKTETKLYEFLKITFPQLIVEKNVKFEWCKNAETGKFLPFDFCVDGRILCELDGGHHFKDIGHWNSKVIDRQARDIYKMTCALQHGFRIIRLSQEDVWKNKNDWDNKLKTLIKDDMIQLSFVMSDNILVNDTYAIFAGKCGQNLK